MEEYKREQVLKSFGIFSKRPLSSKELEGWTESISDFVKRSDPDSETLVALVVRFENRFPKMINRVGQSCFEKIRGDIFFVPLNNDKTIF